MERLNLEPLRTELEGILNDSQVGWIEEARWVTVKKSITDSCMLKFRIKPNEIKIKSNERYRYEVSFWEIKKQFIRRYEYLGAFQELEELVSEIKQVLEVYQIKN